MPRNSRYAASTLPRMNPVATLTNEGSLLFALRDESVEAAPSLGSCRTSAPAQPYSAVVLMTAARTKLQCNWFERCSIVERAILSPFCGLCENRGRLQEKIPRIWRRTKQIYLQRVSTVITVRCSLSGHESGQSSGQDNQAEPAHS